MYLPTSYHHNIIGFLISGEVLQNCECGFKIASIFALRQHQSACPAVLTKKSLKKSAPVLQKRASFAKDNPKVGSSKRTKVELRDELKDLIKIGTPAVRLRKKKWRNILRNSKNSVEARNQCYQTWLVFPYWIFWNILTEGTSKLGPKFCCFFVHPQ